MEKMKKVTKKDNFKRMIEVIREADVEDADVLVEALEHEIELVSKRKTGKTKVQKENEVIMEGIYDLIDEKPATVTEIYEKAKDTVDGVTSSQKVSALVKKLVEAGRVVRTEDKKKAYFARA